MKTEIIAQIKRELHYKRQDQQCLRDAEFFKALAQGKRIERCLPKLAQEAEFKRELVKRLKAASGLPEKTPRENKMPELKKIYDLLGRYTLEFPSRKNLVLVGAVGTGKTYAAQTVASKLLDRTFSVIFVTAFTLVQRFKDYIFNFENAALNNLLTCDLLVIDDLGTEPKIKNISDEYLLNVINERQAQGKPFIITTNLSLEDILERYDERLTSRILSKTSSVVIEMKGKDLRLA